MGRRAKERRRVTDRKIRGQRLSEAERAFLIQNARYEGSPYHKRDPGNFGLTPPSRPRPDATLCDEAGLLNKEQAERLLQRAIDRGLVSEASAAGGYPKQLWAYDGGGRRSVGR
ncbi:MAG: hypothetical protein IPG45_30090 [Deltaproteobacteria bacterium]|jgi:hypothetical protein|nr:hypothetical protein [Deltaproteobacteria bacterium]